MTPAPLDAAIWAQAGRVLDLLYLFAGLAIAGATAFALAHAVIPSLAASGEAPRPVVALRRVFYPLFAVALVMALYALWRALAVALELVRAMYPRLAI
jgi:hypothetical protein